MIKHYVDEVPPVSGRKYNIETDQDNKSTITDVTEYTQEGSSFGATDICAIGIIEVIHSKSGTVHNLITSNSTAENIKFKAVSTMPYVEGDTFLFNNVAYVGKTLRGENLPNGCFAGDVWVFGILDHVNHILFIDVPAVPLNRIYRCNDASPSSDKPGYKYVKEISFPGMTADVQSIGHVSAGTYNAPWGIDTLTDKVQLWFEKQPASSVYVTITFIKTYT